MVARKTWVSKNFGPISKSHIWWVSKSRFWVILRLGVLIFLSLSLEFWNMGLAVSQSLEFFILYPYTVYTTYENFFVT